MSVIQVEGLVSYHLRAGYLNDVADGVGERLITLNETFLAGAPFKSAGWRPNPALVKRTHSPPIPTAVASEYFQAPRPVGLTLEDEADDGQLFGAGGGGGHVGGGAEHTATNLAAKRRRRRELMEEDDSSDLSDESDDELDQRAAQQIKFAKMPLRHRSGSSPIRQNNSSAAPAGPDRPPPIISSPRAAPPRRGSQSALETVKERARRDTVTSSEVSSENEFDASGFHRQQQEASRNAAASRSTTTKLSSSVSNAETSITSVRRRGSELLAEEDEDEDSDASDMSSAFVGSLDSASILDAVGEPVNPPPGGQVVGTPPKEFIRRSTIRRSAMPAPLHLPIGELPPPRPISMIRPVSMYQPKSLLSAALKVKKTKPTLPFDKFASLSGQGDPNPIRLRIYAPFTKVPAKPFDVLIHRHLHEGEGSDRPAAVADLIGLSLWRYNEEKLEPRLPSAKLNVNWWMLRMVEEDGEVDDDFPPLERKKQLTSFTTANNKAGRGRSNSRVYDMFALVQASEPEFERNQKETPEFEQEQVGDHEVELNTTPRSTPRPPEYANANTNLNATVANAPREPHENPILNTIYNPNAADVLERPYFAPHPPSSSSLALLASQQQQQQQPAQQTQQSQGQTAGPNANPSTATAPTARGEKRLLRIHMYLADAAPGQILMLEVTTEWWLDDVLDAVCRRRQLDKAAHVLRLPQSGVVVPLDRTLGALGTGIMDVELHRRRFATDGISTMAGGSGAAAVGSASGSLGSSSPRPYLMGSSWSRTGGGGFAGLGGGMGAAGAMKMRAGRIIGQHPLAREMVKPEGELLGGAAPSPFAANSFKRYTVWRKQAMRLLAEKLLVIDGENIRIVPANNGKMVEGGDGKMTTVHFSNVVGCKVSRKHRNNFKLVVFKTTEEKRYDFVTNSPEFASEIVEELKKGISPYREL